MATIDDGIRQLFTVAVRRSRPRIYAPPTTATAAMPPMSKPTGPDVPRRLESIATPSVFPIPPLIVATAAVTAAVTAAPITSPTLAATPPVTFWFMGTEAGDTS